MKKTAMSLLLVLFICGTFAIAVSGQTREIDVATERLKGDKIRGPATLKLKNLNILRYDIQIGTDVTFTNGPDLTLPFIPPVSTQPQGAAPNTGAAAASNPIQAKFEGYVNEMISIDTERVTDVQTKITEAISATNGAKDELESLVSSSDSILGTGGGPISIINALNPLLTTINSALTKQWPEAKIQELLGRLDTLKINLLTLPSTSVGPGQPNWSQWYTGGNKDAYDATVARVNELQNILKAIDVNSQVATTFRDAQNKLRRWRPILQSVRDGGPSGFTRTVRIGCGFAFDQTKSSKVEIFKRDRLADTPETREEIITVECTTPLSVSAGFGFSSITERDFAFVKSTKPGTNDMGQPIEVPISRFGFTNRSSFRTLPAVLLNTRLYDFNDTFAIHASMGAAVDIKTGDTGTDVEFIVGPSISFKRTLFITPGLHIGRVPTLAGGFNVDDEVPTGVEEPPIEKSWKKGFAVTFTFKVR